MQKHKQAEIRNLLSKAIRHSQEAVGNYSAYMPTLDHEEALRQIDQARERLREAEWEIGAYLSYNSEKKATQQ